MTSLYDLPTALKDDALTFLCGKYLGSGVSRQTYVFVPNPKLHVIKVEVNSGWMQNSKEWHVWAAVNCGDYPELAKWFAPCVRISDLGVFLLQRRTKPLTVEQLRKRAPKVPAFFTDLKAGNWGEMDGRVVCHDYGTSMTTERGLTRTMRKAEWSAHED